MGEKNPNVDALIDRAKHGSLRPSTVTVKPGAIFWVAVLVTALVGACSSSDDAAGGASGAQAGASGVQAGAGASGVQASAGVSGAQASAGVSGAQAGTGATGTPADAGASGVQADAGVPTDAGSAADAASAMDAGSAETRCTPGEPEPVVVGGGPIDQCHDVATYVSVPNGDGSFISGAHLPAPTTAGQPYTLALGMQHSGGPGSVELWGADGPCGVALELLYWTDDVDQTFCATFTSSQSYSELLIVMRNLEGGSISFRDGPITFCGPAGVCEGPNTGLGLAQGVELDAPMGDYHALVNDTPRRGTLDIYIETRGLGRMIAVLPGVVRAGESQPIMHGVFRTPPADPYGDAWYCIGDGSTFTQRPDRDGYDVSLRSLTRLRCPAAGSGSFAIDFDGSVADVTTTLASLSAAVTTSYGPRCQTRWCWFNYEPSASLDSWLFLTAAQDVGDSTMPSNTLSAVEQGIVFTAPSDGSGLDFACGSGGSITYGADVATTLELTGLGALGACPGDPVDESEVDFRFY